MADLSDKGSESSSESQTKRSKNKQDAPSSPSSSDNQLKRTCVDCGTSKTPLWRGGPGGPKSLCNACGIRNRKRRWALLGVKKTVKTKPSSNNNKFHDSLKTKPSSINNKFNDSLKTKASSNDNNNVIGTTDNKFNDSVKRRLFKLGKEFMLQKANAEKQRLKLGEVEEAACLLMALAYGSVSA